MNYLLDTHIFLWMVSNPENLSKRSAAILENRENVLYFSVASAWEILIKQQIGKLVLKSPAEHFIRDELSYYGINVLPIHLEHVFYLSKLPTQHRDPFDRILISQSSTEKLQLVTNDKMIKKYKVKTIW